MSSSDRASLRARALLVALTLLACLAALEIGLRVLGRAPSNTTDGIFEAHGTGYRLKKNMSKLSRTPSFTCTIYTDSNGFRDGKPGPRALGDEPYFAFVGDSLTFANGVEYEDSFVGAFAQRARKLGYDVVNLAVGGHRFSDQEDQLNDFLAAVPRPPAEVVVVFTAPFVNLFEERYSDLLIKNGYIFRKDAWLLPYLTVTLGNTSSAYCFFRNGIRRLQSRLFDSGPRAAFELLEPFSKKAPSALPAFAERLEARLDGLDGAIRHAGAAPIYVYLPSSADLSGEALLALTGMRREDYDFLLYRDLLGRHCKKAGIEFVDLLPLLQKLQADHGVLTFMQDMHYNVATNHAIGDALYASLLDGARLPLPVSR